MCGPATQTEPAPGVVATPVMARPRVPVWLMAMLLVLGTIALYWPATRCNFVILDDGINVTSVVQIQNGLSWESVKWAFLNPMATLWHPLTVLSHMLDCQLFGLDSWGHHLTNVLLHALNAGLVFAWLRQMTGATWRSLLVAGLFAAHPLRVEVVAWVTERREVLCTFFGLLALIAYTRYARGSREKAESRKQKAEKGSPKPEAGGRWSVVRGQWSISHLPSSIFYLLSLLFFALGLMSKPMLVTWPFVMLLLDYWPLRRMQNAECRRQKAEGSDTSTLRSAAEDGQHATPVLRSSTAEGGRTMQHVSGLTPQSPIANRQSQILFPLLVEKIPFFVLVVLMSVVTYVVQKGAGALALGESLPLSERLGNALVSYCRYLGKMFWPTDLTVFYVHLGQWPLGKVLLAGGLILGLSVWLWGQRRRYPFLLMGWLWYCGTLVPVSQVIQTATQSMADRWTYIPSLGVLILIVWGACELTRGWRYQVLALSVAGGAAIVFCVGWTRHQIGYWRGSEALLRHAVAVTENNYPAHRNLGFTFYMNGQMDEALSQFQKAVRLRPDFPEAYDHLGITFSNKGQLDEAIRQFQEALRLNPYYADAHYNLGVAYYQQGRTNDAIRQFEETIRWQPDHAEAHHNIGVILGLKGQTDEAIRLFQEALRLKPDYADARRNLDLLLATRANSPPSPGAATNR